MLNVIYLHTHTRYKHYSGVRVDFESSLLFPAGFKVQKCKLLLAGKSESNHFWELKYTSIIDRWNLRQVPCKAGKVWSGIQL